MFRYTNTIFAFFHVFYKKTNKYNVANVECSRPQTTSPKFLYTSRISSPIRSSAAPLDVANTPHSTPPSLLAFSRWNLSKHFLSAMLSFPCHGYPTSGHDALPEYFISTITRSFSRSIEQTLRILRYDTISRSAFQSNKHIDVNFDGKICWHYFFSFGS